MSSINNVLKRDRFSLTKKFSAEKTLSIEREYIGVAKLRMAISKELENAFAARTDT